MPVVIKMPEYVATHKPEDFINPTRIPFSWANGVEGKTFYQALLDFPARLKQFNIAMTTQEASLPVLGMYPFGTLDEDREHDRPFIVDVGGGRGQSLMQIKNANPHINRRMILQDRQAVLDAVPDDQIPGVEKMVYDFYTPQPVKSKITTADCTHHISLFARH